MEISQLLLPALDGANPQGFLAALGVLDALVQEHDTQDGDPPKLSWRFDGQWRAVLHTTLSLDGVVQKLDQDRKNVLASEALNFSFGDGIADVNAPPEDFRAFLNRIPYQADNLDSDYAAAFASDAVFETKGVVKASLLRFASAQQRFLAIARKNGAVATQDVLKETLQSWTYANKTAFFGWDAAICRDYSLLGQDPSAENTKWGNPGAEWLSFRGFRLFPSVRQGRKIATTCIHGHWAGKFVWPLWTTPLSRTVIPFILRLKMVEYDDEGCGRLGREVLLNRGISAVLESDIVREGKGFGRMRPSRTLFARPL